jgi:hypothetical protein
MIGFESWMRCRHELDSKICHVERSARQAIALCEGWKHLGFFAGALLTR